MSDPTIATARLPADAEGVARAAYLLGCGELVAIPTETVYGLGADASDPAAVAKIFAAKQRPRFNPLIAHLPDLAAARREGHFDDAAMRLARAFWPGPLTLVVPVSNTASVCELARAGLNSVALRVPAHDLARDLLARLGRPLAAPSANRSGRISPTCAEHVLADLDGRIAAVLDGGNSAIGVESTVIACLDSVPRLLRPGGIARDRLAEILGRDPAAASPSGAKPIGPGQLASHYAPNARVRLEANAIEPGEAVLLFGAFVPIGLERALAVENLSGTADIGQAAARLFSALRRLDESGAASIAVVPVPDDGLGEAINDRLRRAAAPR